MTNQVFIATIGCSGSSLLMAILTKLGMDTGTEYVEPNNTLQSFPCYGGQYETKFSGNEGQKNHDKRFPYIIKSSRICTQLIERTKRWDWEVDHVYGLIRGGSFKDAVKDSELRNKKEGHWEAQMSIPSRVERVTTNQHMLEGNFIALCSSLAKVDVPFTLLSYPEYALDLPLTYKKLKLLMDKYDVSYDRFAEVCDELVDERLIQLASEEYREEGLT